MTNLCKSLFYSGSTFLLLIFLTGIVYGDVISPPVPYGSNITNCLLCHDAIEKLDYQQSAHVDLSCIDCHTTLEDKNDHHLGKFKHNPVSCVECHEEPWQLHSESIHAKEAELTCTDCHGEIHHLQKIKNKKIAIVKNCTGCHGDDFSKNGHGKHVFKDNSDAPDCGTCHGVHKVLAAKQDRSFYDTKCIGCHDDSEKMIRSGQRTDTVSSYRDTYHGKVQKLGYAKEVAGCSDCHGSHNTLPSTSPKANIHESNLIESCRACHPKVRPKFAAYISHPRFLGNEKNPVLFWTFVVMISLFGATVCFFTLHTLFWFSQCRNEIACQKEIKTKLSESDEIYYERFCLSDRLLHFLLMASFFTLLLTGMPLLFKDAFWAESLFKLLGGPIFAGHLHRVAACIQIGVMLFALYKVFRYFIRNRKKGGLTKLLFSPDSVMLNRKDWADVKNMFKWFFRTGPKPHFERFSYWEKAEILSFFWGTFVVGTTGILLWFPEFFSNIFPGWIYNVALLIHAVEAMLATFVIIISHYFVTHLHPHNFPMDTVIFTGCVHKHEMHEKRRTHFERLQMQDDLAALAGSPPSVMVKAIAGIVGTFFVILGLSLFVLILLALFV